VLGAASSADPIYNGLDPADISVTNIDNDTAGFTVTPTSGLTTTEAGGKAKIQLAPRPIDLAGKVVGLLDNTKEQADVILETVAETLRERYGVAKVIIRRKEYYSKPATAALMDEMAKRGELRLWPRPPVADPGTGMLRALPPTVSARWS